MSAAGDPEEWRDNLARSPGRHLLSETLCAAAGATPELQTATDLFFWADAYMIVKFLLLGYYAVV